MSEYGNFLQRREPGTALISSFCNNCTQALNCQATVALQNKLKANDGIEQKTRVVYQRITRFRLYAPLPTVV